MQYLYYNILPTIIRIHYTEYKESKYILSNIVINIRGIHYCLYYIIIDCLYSTY